MFLHVACIQTTSTDSVEHNIHAIAPLLREAAMAGATLVALPENAFWMRKPGDELPKPLHCVGTHAGVAAACEWARSLSIWILIGSVAVVDAPTQEKLFNRSLLIAPDGRVCAQYDKIHLFDVVLPNGDIYAESEHFRAGNQPVVAGVGEAMLALSICYDLRFPALYRKMAKMGAEILAVPAAFTVPTGEAHWQVLLRARAIETGCFVMAPAQCGEHPGGRKTYGHSMIISPWGSVLAEAGVAPGWIDARLDLCEVSAMRSQIPSLLED